MLKRARSTESSMRLQTSNGQQRSNKVRKYLQQVDCFLALLLGCVHIELGQLAQGSKIITMRHRNRLLQNCNVFVVDGAVITVMQYYKLQSQQDKPKVVPRFLPPRLEQVIVLYLSYLQPFREYLVATVLRSRLDDYIQSNKQGAQSTDRLTRVLQRETSKRLSVELSTLGYRYTAVRIGRAKVGELFSKGY